MAYTNSPLVKYTRISPNHSGKRTHPIDRISPHCVVGQCTAEGLGDWFAKPSTKASSNYGIDRNGRVGLYVEEKNRSWCTSSNANDQRAVTIECASGMEEPYAMNSAVYDTLILLCTDICRRNGKRRLLWIADKQKALNYSPKADEMVLTVHRWFANKSCPGSWLYSRLGDLAEKVTGALASGKIESEGTQSSVFSGLSEAEAVEKAGPLFTADQRKSGILASVSMAQFILESGYGKTELAQKANNLFGMKCSLSGNTWAGSTWDGKSMYRKRTQEQNPDGSYETITADFRKYPCLEDSIADHSAYLLGAKNGNRPRYDGLKGCRDYRQAAAIIKAGGYATDLAYVEKLCSIIERWDLIQYDAEGKEDVLYRVRRSWLDAASQKGAFYSFAKARECADSNPGYTVYDPSGKAMYSSKAKPGVPYMVKVSINDLNIRKGPGTDFAKTGKYTGKGIFTIVEEREGNGSSAGWGRLKSGAGWIALSYCTKV